MYKFVVCIALVAGVALGYLVAMGGFDYSKNLDEQPEQVIDAYAGWQTVSPGNVITMRIPADCTSDPAAGSMYIVCPSLDGSDPLPSMVASSDGIIVNIRRYEDTEWEHWDKVIESIRVIAPVREDFALTIQK